MSEPEAAVPADMRLVPVMPRESLATAILDSLNDDPSLPLEQIEITLAGADVVLAGAVTWRYQCEQIEYRVDQVEGVRSVRNEIAVTPTVEVNEAIAATITEAADRTGRGDTDSIRVEADGDGTLTLFGNVGSDVTYRAALAAAWAVPGVQNVVERLAVG
jgi:osmotically-inducible protein OsmY